MAHTVEGMIEDILRREGGFVDHPADRGGPTKFGVTQRTLSAYLGRAASVEDVRGLSVQVAAEIYRRDYFAGPGLDGLPKRVQPFVFDSAVNHGPRRAIRLVQQVCEAAGFGPIAVDGVCGPQTCRVAGEAERVMGEWLLAALVEERRNLYRRIVANDPSQRVFLDGWMNRVAEFDIPVEGLVT